MAEPSGLFLVDKPAGPTSFGVLRELRPALGQRLGHAGTLDPFATGLLLVLAGRSTRLAVHLTGHDKSYRAEVQFGAVSPTLDPEGEITCTGGTTDLEAVRRAAAGLVGERLQRVPAASAVKVAGERAYRRMRRGERVEMPARPVRIDRLEVLAFDRRLQVAEIDVTCSKGTYVRQIAADLGEATGAGALCRALRRTAVGPFTVEQAGTPAEVAADPHGRWYRRPAEALQHLPARQLDAAAAAAVRHGRRLVREHEHGTVRLLFGDELVALAEPRDAELQPVVVL
ncbi:MAG TPA: tRNA pseudouridine(55) synthase TruB [Gaiellales bacterium]|nr:tRNA pseudouridine(55) synthase TruB [Gaiellales bacterium]